MGSVCLLYTRIKTNNLFFYFPFNLPKSVNMRTKIMKVGRPSFLFQISFTAIRWRIGLPDGLVFSQRISHANIIMFAFKEPETTILNLNWFIWNKTILPLALADCCIIIILFVVCVSIRPYMVNTVNELTRTWFHCAPRL